MASGCTSIFSKPVMSAAPQSLPWLASLAAPAVDTTPPFDLAQIQPAPKSGITADELLEITIWDLYEPGKPHTFPTRIDSQGHIVVPHLDPVPVVGATPAEVESRLVEAYRQHDLLKQPRILVRELVSTPLHVYVTGAVLRPGVIDLPPRDASVFAALIASGGLSKNAGWHVFVSDHAAGKAGSQALGSVPEGLAGMPLVVGNAGLQLTDAAEAIVQPPGPPQPDQPPAPENETIDSPPQQLVNHSEPLNVSEDGQSRIAKDGAVADGPSKSGIEEKVVTRPDIPSGAIDQNQPGRWYDLSVDRDRELLKNHVLRDGDTVTVRPAAPPVRITGAVSQPGSYRAPAANALTLLDAIQLAGGFTSTELPMIVVLTRPATAEHGMQRWSFRMGRGEKVPSNVPYVQPGDLLHVEPTARARVQSLMDALLPGTRN